jgi:uncharacterized membrane protein
MPADEGFAPSEVPDPLWVRAREWLFGGNTVARVGLLVLFVGVAFLLRYVAEHTKVPIEARLIGVALGALVFLGLGWRLRERRPGFALTLQGGAIGILYLTAFAALRLYGVLTPGPAFVFMAGLAALSGVLAVLQDGRALATLGAFGGFAVPLLISTGSGRVEMLFTFYLLLDLGVLGIAWFRAWRELNWIAFLFTFSVSGLWATQRYTPQEFAIGQGFLVAFWLLFLLVAQLYAMRQKGPRRGRFDTTLVIALPLVAFGIQTRFTQGIELAIASAIGAAVYLAVSTALLRRRDPALRLLIEANFGLGVAFLTLAVPLAASALWSSAAWALEGVATTWVGLRQRRSVPQVAGIVLQVLAAAALAQAVYTGEVSFAPQWSGVTINLMVLAACAFGVAWLLTRWSATDSIGAAQWPRAECAWTMRLVAWGWVAAALWQPLQFPGYGYAWCVLALALIAAERRGARDAAPSPVSPDWVMAMILVVAAMGAALALPQERGSVGLAAVVVPRLVAAATALAAALLSFGSDGRRRLAAAVLLSLALFGWLFAILADAIARQEPAIAVAQIGLVMAGVAAFPLAWLGQRLHWDWPDRMAWIFHAGNIVLAAYVVATAVLQGEAPSSHYGMVVWPIAWAAYYVRFIQAGRGTFSLSDGVMELLHVAGLWLLPAMIAAQCAISLERVAEASWAGACWGAAGAAALWFATHRPARWPVSAASRAYLGVGSYGLVAFALAWLVQTDLLSPGDAAPLPSIPLLNPIDVASLLLLGAMIQWRNVGAAEWRPDRSLVSGVAVFFIANVALLRALHFEADIAWSFRAWVDSLLVQASLSILWTILAMGAMLAARRYATRALWFIGAGLLGAVVVKLFLVDLSGRGTVERIISFVVVGLLIMLIGYLTPVPPSAEVNTRDTVRAGDAQ